MNQQVISENVWRDQASDILELLSISDSSLLDDTGEYWRRVTSLLHIPVKDSEVANARACIDTVGGTWDDEEYVADGKLIRYKVYQELLALLVSLEPGDFEDLLEGEARSRQ